ALAERIQPRAASASAIWTALVAAPLRRLSLTTQNAMPRPSATDSSARTPPTYISSLPPAPERDAAPVRDGLVGPAPANVDLVAAGRVGGQGVRRRGRVVLDDHAG